MATAGDPVRLSGKLVSADYFNVFGVKARLGRSFAPGEDQPGAIPVVVLSYAMWQTQFAGDPDVLKRELTLDGEPHRIIGVLPKGSFDRDEARFWKPLIFAPEQLNRGQHWLHVIGRLRSGVSIEQARARMNTLRASLAAVMPAWKKDWGFTVDPFAQLLVGDTLRRSIYLAFGAVLMVLLIACANVANLVLAKGAARRKEMALRASLGGRPRPFDRAVAHREPGLVSSGRHGGYCGGLPAASCRSPIGGGIAAVYGRSQPGSARPWLCRGGRDGGFDTHGSASFLADFLRQAVQLIESGGAWIVGFERSRAPHDRHR